MTGGRGPEYGALVGDMAPFVRTTKCVCVCPSSNAAVCMSRAVRQTFMAVGRGRPCGPARGGHSSGRGAQGSVAMAHGPWSAQAAVQRDDRQREVVRHERWRRPPSGAQGKVRWQTELKAGYLPSGRFSAA